MSSYKGTLQRHFKLPVALTDIFTFRDRHDATLLWRIRVYLRTLFDFEIFWRIFGKRTNV